MLKQHGARSRRHARVIPWGGLGCKDQKAHLRPRRPMMGPGQHSPRHCSFFGWAPWRWASEGLHQSMIMFRPDEAQRQRGKPSVQGPFPKSSLPVLSGKVRDLRLPILSPASRMGQPTLPQSGLTPERRRVESVEGQARGPVWGGHRVCWVADALLPWGCRCVGLLVGPPEARQLCYLGREE